MKEETSLPTEAGKSLGTRFAFLQSSLLFSGLSDGVYRVAVPLLTLTLTRDPVVIGLVSASAWLPWLVVALPAGVLADRKAPLGIMRWSQAARLVLLFVLGAIAALGDLPVWLFALCVFLVSASGVVNDVSAQGLVPRIVAEPMLPKANGRVQVIQIGTQQLSGPALAGYCVLLGTAGAFGSMGLVYAVALVLIVLLPMRQEEVATAPADASVRPSSVFGDLKYGLAYFFRRRDLLTIACMAAVMNFAFISMMTILPLWVTEPGPLGASTEVYGGVVALGALGGLSSGVVVHRFVARYGERVVFRFCLFGVALSVLLLCITSVLAVIAALISYSAIVIFFNVANMTYRQRTVPLEVFSRVNAAYRWISWGVMPLSAAASGLITDAVGVRGLFLGTATALFAAGLLLQVPALNRIYRHGEVGEAARE